MMRKQILLLIALCLHMAARGQTLIEEFDLSGLPQPTQAKGLRYWFDDDAGSMKSIGQLSGKHFINVSALIEGLHTLHYQVIDTEGRVAYVRSSVFLKTGQQSTTSAVKSMRYWFDDNAGSVQTASGTTGSYLLNVSQLIEGLHTLHYQLIDESNMTAYVGSGIFLKIDSKSSDTQAKGLRYWFDDDAKNVRTLVSGGIYTLDVSAMLDGLHTIHYQVTGTEGQAAYVASSLFLKIGSNTGSETLKASKLMYWFDDETAIQYVDATKGVQMLDASSLIEGLHTIHYQVLCNKGTITSAMSAIFLRMNSNTKTASAKSFRYWFDEEQTTKEVEISEGVQMLDASRLIEGLHTVHYQVVDSKGSLGAPASSVFLKMDADNASTVAKSIRYWFDDDASTVKVTDAANGTQTLDVANLPIGLHTLNYQLIDSEDRVGIPVTGFFLKNFAKVIEGGKNRITQYQYWMNDNSADMKTVEVSNAANPYTLIGLLPMQKAPILSSFFHFEVPNGVPMIYARDVFHIRFYDAQGYFTDNNKPFIDYSISQAVKPVGKLKETQTFDRVAENAIRWYSVDLEEGDSVAFKTNQACSIQLFAPSGEEVYSAQGSTSVTLDGCHAWEEGTYYLAVHDVTGSQNKVTLEYMHMDKYDVVSQDVAVVGNGGCSTITFSGNGFKDLYAVDLYTDNGDTIHSINIGHESDASTSVTFDFTDATLGKYHAVFHFSEESKNFNNLLTVEEAKNIELATNVSFPRGFPHGLSTTYTVKITNKGNMTAYSVPIYTYIMNKNDVDGIYHVKYDGLGLKGLLDGVDLDSLSTTDKQELLNLVEEIGDDHYFLHFYVEDEDSSGDSVWVRSNYFFTNIAPYETKTLKLTISANEGVWAYFTVPDDWPTINSVQKEENSSIASSKRRGGEMGGYCCIHEQVECYLNWASLGADLVSLIPQAKAAKGVSCLLSWTSTISSISATFFCDKDQSLLDKLMNQTLNNGLSTLASLFSCQAKDKDKKIAATLKFFKGLLKGGTRVASHAKNLFDCKSSTNKTPGCPPPPPGGGGSNGGGSWDPNDIYGYTSESGSKYITDSIQALNYTIEFENDTTFATASAHTVVVKDTLDSKYFDLASFAPTGIKIGEKMEFLDGTQNFVKTIDMRPEIYAIAQVEGKYDAKKGIATWTFTSLDPMTMEPTDDIMSGFLPVNYNGTSGIGEVFFDINLKQKFANGTKIPNRASIVFDINDAIMTPTWTNIIDAIAPTSRVTACEIKNDTTATLHMAGNDNLSGVWKYDVYVQYEENASWFKFATGVADSVCDVRIYEGINHGFYVVAADSAGNVEVKEEGREYTLDLFEPTEDSDLELELATGWNWISHNLNESVAATKVETHAQRILGQEEEVIKDATIGFVGDLTELKPTLGYKIQMQQAADIALEGKLFNASYKSIALSEGWNWIGYPLAHELELAQALEHFTPENGDYIVGQEGFAQYADGKWTGTLATLVPGKGYLYKSGATKQMFFNATATLSSRVESKRRVATEQNLWTCDIHKYPNVMPVTANLYLGNTAEEASDYHVAAFCGNECRGVGKAVNGKVMMNVYGEGNEAITFKAISKNSELLLDVAESLNFTADAVGTLEAPFRMTLGDDTNSIQNIAESQMKISPAIIRDQMTVTLGTTHSLHLSITNANGQTVGNWKKLADGSTVDVSTLPAGVYVVTAKAGKQVFTKKVMKVD